jgi:hypothetical protein
LCICTDASHSLSAEGADEVLPAHRAAYNTVYKPTPQRQHSIYL